MFKKVIACLLLISLLNQLLLPSISFALTSGPTSPEATSFEPVDTTDMVNPLSGDFVYNLPLLEVPGPEGGYPLNLSYHAGLQPNEDASWVGLGWTLNPGAINRSVNGFPDDWKGAAASKRDYWSGGTKTRTDVGVNIPILGTMASAAFGLSFSNDTYEGRKVGWNAGVGFGIPNSPFSIGVGIGVDVEDGSFYGSAQVGAKSGPFSVALGISTQGPYASAGISASGDSNGLNLSESLNIATNFKAVDFSAGAQLSYAGFPVLGVSMSSSSPSPSLSVGGVTASTTNSRAGIINSYTKSVSVNLGIASYSRQKTRYWSDETEASKIFGGLHQNSEYLFPIPSSYAFDNYSLPDESRTAAENQDPNKLQGGALPSYDSYQVTAQGLGGTMRPYTYEGITPIQNRSEMINSSTLMETVSYVLNYLADDSKFRFDNDFSNNYLQDYTDYTALDQSLIFYQVPLTGATPNVPLWSEHAAGNSVDGSRSIDYAISRSDGSIYSNYNNFITPVVSGLSRTAHIYLNPGGGTSNHIAGFAITNSNGVTYHYNLPAYAYDEEIYQENISNPGYTFSRQIKQEGYAYTWHLTAITGPDYVDRGTIGQLDNADYGYWVGFEYGKWSDQFSWRTPSEGTRPDDDGQFRSIAMGKKEVYYVNAVRTRSHVAIFEKDSRLDGKGASREIFDKDGSQRAYLSAGANGQFNINSSQSLKLSKIYLLNTSDAAIIANNSGGTSHYVPSGRTVTCTGCELENNVLDKYDVDAVGRSTLESKSVRIIDFNYDYSLSKGVSNSYDYASTSTKYGKLTLNSVNFRGKGGIGLLPSTDFQYDLDPSESQTYSGTLSSGTLQASYSAFNVGDLLANAVTGAYYGVITSKSSPIGSNAIYSLKNSSYMGSSVSVQIKRTKNPPYSKELYDIWGMYKADYSDSGTSNSNLDRTTTPLSNKSTDVWSLRKVITPMGAEVKVNYEGDTYSHTILNEARPFIISTLIHDGGNNYHFTVNNAGTFDLSSLFKIGDNINMITMSHTVVVYSALASEDFGAPVVTAVSGNQINIQIPPAYKLALDAFPTNDGGNLGFSAMNRKDGGGIRVKSIVVDDLMGVKMATTYKYNLINGITDTQISSGVTSYEPVTLDKIGAIPASGLAAYKSRLYRDMNRILSLSRDVPGPNVMYSNVTIETEAYNAVNALVGKMAGRKTLEFEVFRENMIGKEDVDPPDWAYKAGTTDEKYYTRNLVLKKFVSGIGSLKRMINYDDKGRKLNETINHFLDDGLEKLKHTDFMTAYELRLADYKKQGLLKQRFSETKSVWTGVGTFKDIKATMTALEDFPNIQTGQTVVDYVTGVTRTTVNKEFDFYSGAVVKKISSDSYGNRFMEEIVPAYTKYTDMGIKMIGGPNKNMLTQETAKYTYKLNPSGQPEGLIGATVAIWGIDVPVLNNEGTSITQDNEATNGKVWRQKAAYAWLPTGSTTNGITPVANVTAFNWVNPSLSGTNWQMTSENTLFDVYSKSLEGRDINNLFSATRMGYKNSKVVLSANPAKYSEIAYSGVEDDMPALAGISFGNGIVESANAHTGTKSILLAENGTTFNYTVPLSKLDPTRDYFISAWVKPSMNNVTTARLYYSINGQPHLENSPTFQKFAGEWYLLEMRIPASVISAGTNNLTVGCKNLLGGTWLYFDDFRFYPGNADVVSYVYDKFSGELTYILGNNNLFMKYEYDEAGRLKRIFKEVLGKPNAVKIKEVQYSYKRAGT